MAIKKGKKKKKKSQAEERSVVKETEGVGTEVGRESRIKSP